jgi:aminopeptidase N
MARTPNSETIDPMKAIPRLAISVLLSAAACAPPSLAPAPEVLMSPGIPLPLAEHRARTLSEVEYQLTLDLTRGDSIPGSVWIVVRRAADAGDLVLDYRGLNVASVSVNGFLIFDYVWENGHISIPEHRLASGENVIIARFTSAMAASGASVIRTESPPADSPNGPGDVYLYSLLVPADAHQLFPSFDQPDLKAVFGLEAVVPLGWEVLSNAPIGEVVIGEEAATWTFEPTEPISTYLFAFAAGPWAIVGEQSPPEGRDPMGLYARRSRVQEVDADTLIALNRRALTWLEDYFEMGYPFSKYDILLAPAFPFGGMEHPGAVYYNESRFIFREPPTLTERLGRAATIYHEVAHQWFGDLVTMKWFDDLWLKEGFSTYMAARMQEDLNPGTGAWKTFYLRNKPLAYGIDATRGTTPVWQTLGNLDLAKSNYGPIVYNKAPAILKQLNYLVGDEAFRDGLSALLWEHAFANITWRDLLDALEKSSGISLDAFGEHYILRAGMPVVETELELRDGAIARLALVQRPARTLPGDPGGAWPGRVEVMLGYADRDDVVLPVTFTGHTTEVVEAAGLPAPDFVFANHGDHGYGRFLVDARSAAALADRVGELDDELLRAMVWGALWDLVGEGRLEPTAFLDIALEELPQEPDEQIAAWLLGRSSLALQRYLPGGAGGSRQLQARFEQMLLRRMDDPALGYGQRKASLDALLENARTPAAIEAVLDLVSGGREFDGEPIRQPSRWAAIQTLLALGHPSADSLLAAERERDLSPEAGRRAFVAGAAKADANVKAEYFTRYLEDGELNEEWVTASLDAFNHPEHGQLTLPYLRPALDRLEWIRDNRRIFFLPQWVNSFIGGHSSREALRLVDEYLADNPDLPDDLRRKVLHARDALEVVVRVREASASDSPVQASPTT